MHAIRKGWTQSHKGSCEREVSGRNREPASGKAFSRSGTAASNDRSAKAASFSKSIFALDPGMDSRVTLNSSSRLWICTPRFRLSTEGFGYVGTRILATVYKTVVSDCGPRTAAHEADAPALLGDFLERATGIEPVSKGWEAGNKILKAIDLTALSFPRDGFNWKLDGN